MYHLIDAGIDESLSERFQRKKEWLSCKPQAFFEIDEHHVSSSGWQAAISLMNSLDTYSLPCEKASILVQVAHSIAATFEEERGGNLAMGADDFLPIFVFVLCNSSLSNVTTIQELVSETMIHSVGVGEKGYYVTMLEAAVEYVAAFHHPELPEKHFSGTPDEKSS